VLDKYLGDGFLAFFVSPSGVGDAARQALEAACEMQDAFAELHRSSEGTRLRDMGLGVGVGSGRVVLGNVGSEELMDFTVIGDAVNVAARLQAAASPGEVLITSNVRESAGSIGSSERCLAIELRGRRTPVAVYAITRPNWIRSPHFRAQT
jgi:adenylate cyclase